MGDIMADQISLDKIGLRFGTDKASTGHDYLSFYEKFLSPLRNLQLSILEVGVLGGASLKTWESYFPNAKVTGADIVPASKRFEGGRVGIEILDQSNIQELTQLALNHGPFDIVIEDGSHMCEHQITTLKTLFPFVKSDGIYIVEDLQTNYGDMLKSYRGTSTITCVEYLKKLLDIRVADDCIDISMIEDPFLRTYGRSIGFMTFYRRACLIQKNFIASDRQGSPGSSLVGNGAGEASEPIFITAHVSNTGDIFGPKGFINKGAGAHFQGLELRSAESVLEYRVLAQHDNWTPWVPEGAYLGTRGQSKLLTGVAVRLRDDAKGKYLLRVVGLFAGSEELVEAKDGQDCKSANGSPLYGLQVILNKLM